MIDTAAFGRTGHRSTRVIFGAAALGAMRQEKADQVFDVLLEYGINHIDTAATYGDAELRIGPWMPRYREQFIRVCRLFAEHLAARGWRDRVATAHEAPDRSARKSSGVTWSAEAPKTTWRR